jgi:hypothetical protein
VNQYRYEHGIAHSALDDAKVDALGSVTITNANAELDHAIRDGAAAVGTTHAELANTEKIQEQWVRCTV